MGSHGGIGNRAGAVLNNLERLDEGLARGVHIAGRRAGLDDELLLCGRMLLADQ